MMKHHQLIQVEDYRPLVGADAIERIREKARPLRGMRVAHVNSTYYGGGVAEILSSLALLMNSLGISAEWRVIQGALTFSASPRRCTTPCRAARSISPS